HDDIAAGVGDDVQYFKYRHAAADQRGERPGKTRQADLVRDDPEDGQLDSRAIPEFPPGLGLDVIKPAVNQGAHPRQNVEYITLEDVADADQKLGRPWQFGPESTVDFAEHR